MTIQATTKEAAVSAAFNNFLAAYQARDMDRMMACVAPDENAVLFGTGADERRIGPDELKYQAERDWAQTDALGFNIGWHSVSASGSVAWIAAEGTGQGRAGGQAFEFPFRLTAVFEQRGDQWLLVQSHFSLPAPGQEAGNSVPV